MGSGKFKFSGKIQIKFQGFILKRVMTSLLWVRQPSGKINITNGQSEIKYSKSPLMSSIGLQTLRKTLYNETNFAISKLI